MLKSILLATATIATTLTFAVDEAEAFGGRGYARRQARRAYHAPAPVVRRTHVAPVVRYYSAPRYYRAPVSVGVSRYGGYYRWGAPAYRGGVSIGIGW